MKRFLIGALVLLAAALACASPSTAQTNVCSGGGVQGMIVGGPAGACAYLAVNSDGSIATSTSTSSLTGVKGLDGTTIAGPFNPLPVLIAPSASQGVSTQSCTVACASSIVTGGHGLYGLSFSSTVVGWLLIYDATTCAANGTVTPKKAIAYTVANTTMGVSWNNAPMIDTTGTAACFSSTGPFTATASTTAYISLDYK